MAPSGLLARAADANGLRMPRNACALVLGTLLLAACNRQPPAPAAAVVVPPDAGVVAITADARGFTPAEVHVSKGKAVTFLFTRTTDNTCAKEVVFPELTIRRPLPLNEVVAIMLPTQVEHTYRFQCGMAMWEGTVVVK